MRLVEWEESARDELADVWVLATPEERVQIERIVLGVQNDLAERADRVGESRFDRVRVESRSFLTFWFSLSADGHFVRIFHLHRPRQ